MATELNNGRHYIEMSDRAGFSERTLRQLGFQCKAVRYSGAPDILIYEVWQGRRLRWASRHPDLFSSIALANAIDLAAQLHHLNQQYSKGA